MATKKTRSKKATPKPARPIVLERWVSFQAPTRLVVLPDGELEVQYKNQMYLGWRRDTIPELSVQHMGEK